MKRGYLISVEKGIDNIMVPESFFQTSKNEPYFSYPEILDFIALIRKYRESKEVVFTTSVTKEG